MAKNYPQETKAEVMAALLQGQSVPMVAAEYDVPEGTIRAWKSRANHVVAPVAEAKKEAIGELLIGYLEANLDALRSQAVVFANPEWLEMQNASNLAVLHGVMTDKAVRLLEAFGRAESTDADD